MFVLLLKYVKSLEMVEQMLPAHIAYLDKYYSLRKFICSGRQQPRRGGVILCQAQGIDEVREIVKEDPFCTNQIAEYEIIEFIPSKYDDQFKPLLGSTSGAVTR